MYLFAGAKKSTTSDYDDDAKTKQQQQKLIKKSKKDMQALAAVADSGSSTSSSSASTSSNSNVSNNSTNTNTSSCSSNGNNKNRKISTKETQSRNPIRRSQSERQPTNTTTYHGNSNNKKREQQQQQHVNNSGSNENIISNTRNSLKDIENIPNNINDNKIADCVGLNMNNMAAGKQRTVAIRGGVGGNKTSVHFHDTMALRNRYNRNDTRDLFSMNVIERPREPPPPPPATVVTTSSAVTPTIQSCLTAKEDIANATTLSNSFPKAMDLKESRKSSSSTLALKAIESVQSLDTTNKGLDNSQPQEQLEKSTIVKELQQTATTEINEATFNQNKTKLQQQQQMVGKTKTLNELTNSEKTSTDLSLSYNTLSSSTNNTTTKEQQNMTSSNSSSSNNNKQPKQQKTVVRVAPFNKNSSEIHRLKISHTDNNISYPHSPLTPNTPNSAGYNNSQIPSPFSNSSSSSHYSVTDLSVLNATASANIGDYGQKKTSILINGDDCYSTMNLSCDDSGTPLYQSSVVVTDGSSKTDTDLQGLKVTNTYNTVTINVSSPRSSEDELIQQHNQLNNLLKRQAKSANGTGSIRAIIPIRGTIDINLQRSASSTSSTSTSSITSSCSSNSSSSAAGTSNKRGKTLIRLDYDKEKVSTPSESKISSTMINEPVNEEEDSEEWLPHEQELLKILRNPVEAVKRNLVPHICKLRESDNQKDSKRSKKMKERHSDIMETSATSSNSSGKSAEPTTFIAKLLEDPMLQQVAEGLETDTIAELIENSLKRLQESRNSLDMTGTKDNDDMNRLIDISLKRIQEERSSASKENSSNANLLNVPSKDEERLSNRGSISSANSFASAHNYELFDFEANESDCYQSCSSDINSIMEEDIPSAETKSKFYQMLVDATLQEIELSTNIEDLTNDEHQYESIRHNIDPIYEEISDVPPPLPLTAPPLNDPELEKKSARSIFEGASKYDILSYLVDAKERGLVKEEPFDYPLNCSNPIIIEEESADTLSDLGKLNKLKRIDTISSRSSIMSDSSDDNQSTMSSLSPPTSNNFMLLRNKQATSDIERNDSGVGSETSKSSRSKFLNPTNNLSSSPSPSPSPTSNFNPTSSSSSSSTHQHSSQPRNSPLHLCEDCDGPVETQIGENGHIFAPLVCRKCGKKRVERKEIITEVVETEEKYGRDLQIILEEFCHPMLVAGLLTQEQLSAIFLNTEELLENNQTLAERMRDALDIALEQGDDDLLTVNIGKIFLESTQMLHAFESYCVRQAGASLLLANLEKEKELLRIFLKVSQMENAVLRRMNLNSFLMVSIFVEIFTFVVNRK